MPRHQPDRRTALITVGGIAAAVAAGAFALSANIGILDASADSGIGGLAAVGDLVPTTAEATTPVTTGIPQTYVVDVAGTVSVDAPGDMIAVGAVVANPGWTWSEGPSDATHVEVTFTDGVRALVFSATRSAEGSIDAGVHEAATATATTAPSNDDDQIETEDETEDEHEGRDDDD